MAFLPPATSKGGRRSRQTAIGRTTAALDHGAAVERITAAILSSTAEEEAFGLGWYAAAHDIARELSAHPHVGAGVLAAVSPQTGWVDNVTAARLLADDPDRPDVDVAPFCLVTDYTSGRARQILTGADPFDILGGRKVRSFYSNILRPDRSGPVTVDRHAVVIALHGHGTPTAAVSDKWLERSGAYSTVASCYRTVGRRLGILPHQAQAIAWTVHRNALDRAAAQNPTSNLAGAHIRARRNLESF